MASFYLVLRDHDNRQIIAESTVETRRQTLDIIQPRFNAGAVSEVDVNQAQIQLAEAEAAVESLVQLYKALGDGWNPLGPAEEAEPE